MKILSLGLNACVLLSFLVIGCTGGETSPPVAGDDARTDDDGRSADGANVAEHVETGSDAGSDSSATSTCPASVTANGTCNVDPETVCYDDCRGCHCMNGSWLCPSLACDDASGD